MAELMQFLLSGVTVGAVYALVALGFTIIYNASDVVNFAQGEFVMLGGMITVFRAAVRLVLPTLNDLERADSRGYDNQPESRGTAMPAEERSHARLLQSLSGGAGVDGAALARLEGRHRAASGNALRAAVLGANDGLLSNFSLVMGVAGAQVSADTILVTGLAGLLAGAGSMAMGEWVSVQSARELAGHQLEIEARELEEIPDEEREELALIYEAKGLGTEEARGARRAADRRPRDRARHARARGARHRPRGARRLRCGRGRDLVRALRPRRDRAGDAVLLPRAARPPSSSAPASAWPASSPSGR